MAAWWIGSPAKCYACSEFCDQRAVLGWPLPDNASERQRELWAQRCADARQAVR